LARAFSLPALLQKPHEQLRYVEFLRSTSAIPFRSRSGDAISIKARLQACSSGKEEQPKMKPERRAATPSSTVALPMRKKPCPWFGQRAQASAFRLQLLGNVQQVTGDLASVSRTPSYVPLRLASR
jgi:hypothetical protein